MFPEPTELLLIGCLIESIWTTKIKIKYIDTKNQLADVLTKGSFTRDEWRSSSSTVEHHEFLDVFLQPFSFEQKEECHVQEISGKYGQRRFGSGETETDEFGVKELPQRKENPSARCECFEQPGESRELCFIWRQEN